MPSVNCQEEAGYLLVLARATSSLVPDVARSRRRQLVQLTRVNLTVSVVLQLINEALLLCTLTWE